jgi:hypothetical protein
MIAADTSTWISFLEGDAGEDIEMLAKALGDRQVVMAPPVLTELLSDPELSASVAGMRSLRKAASMPGSRSYRETGTSEHSQRPLPSTCWLVEQFRLHTVYGSGWEIGHVPYLAPITLSGYSNPFLQCRFLHLTLVNTPSFTIARFSMSTCFPRSRNFTPRRATPVFSLAK